jgi:DNA-binding MarR family transcriptional regulator
MTTVPSRQHTVNKHDTSTTTRSAAGDAFSMLAILVIRLHGLVTAEGDALARPAGQTSARWQVLAGAEGGPTTVATIARRLGLARQSVQRVADVLETEGLVAYEDNPRHRRAKLLTLTERGGATLAAIQAAQRTWANALGKELGEADLRRANVVLERAFEALSKRRARAGRSPVTEG